MDTRHQLWEQIDRASDRLTFGGAEQLSQEETAGTWKEYSYPIDYDDEARAGKHPRTFRGYLEGLTWERRKLGHKVPGAGTLERLVTLYRWGVTLGMNADVMTLLGYEAMQGLHRSYSAEAIPEATEHVKNALAEKAQYGRYFRVEEKQPGKKTTILETKDNGDDTYTLLALTIQEEGTGTYRNVFPKRVIHWLCTRMRAQNRITNV